jgi:hypothetical protein
LFVLVVAGGAPALAQDQVPLPTPPPVSSYATSGILEVEGGVDYRYLNVGDVSSSAIVLNPAVRYFIMNGLAVGLRFGYAWVTDGAHIFNIVPQAEYNVSLGGRLFPYVGLGAGVQYINEGGEGDDSSTDFVVEPGAGIKLAMGGGLIGLGVTVPLLFADDFGAGFSVLTRYAIYF